ncbi:M4 family metallopeptidase [Staphylococcus massiliensis]|uniref:M4 family metallopeptidase n=1 Tax=Staphylococcus massiliensis TaxID=555791 RepID=UPI001EDD8261|nr:M4 family metallopeptidase [Staphylococcus massiliensis]MCG3412088.1 M4 family metallopeptidase [Staphylococcus massiliensis]
MNKKLILTLGVATLVSAPLSTQALHAKEDTKERTSLLQSANKDVEQKTVTSNADAKKALQSIGNNGGGTSSRSKTSSVAGYKNYEVTESKKDEQGFTHYTLKPKVNGVEADNEIKLHTNKSNKVEMINGSVDKKNVTVSNQQKVSKQQAIKSAFKGIGKKQSEVKNINGHKVVDEAKLQIDSDKNKLVYNVKINYIKPNLKSWEVKVDAETGEVLSKANNLKEENVQGSGTGVKGDTKEPLNVFNNNGTYELKDTTKPTVIETFDAQNTNGIQSKITNDSPNFTKENHRAGVDAHYNVDKTYKYYKDTFNRESYDNNAAPMESIVHYQYNLNNAYWNGQYMIFGDGDGQRFTSLAASDDVIAHELTHAVTDKTAKLVYQNQPGALNESFSDVFGYFVDDEDWLMGEDSYTPGQEGDALRSMSNPRQFNQPDHMDRYQYTSQDNGGVHINSGIPNKAAYNTINEIGKEKSEKIYYRALTQYLTGNSQFTDAKQALIQSAEDLYGPTEAQAVEQAWNQVGVN